VLASSRAGRSALEPFARRIPLARSALRKPGAPQSYRIAPSQSLIVTKSRTTITLKARATRLMPLTNTRANLAMILILRQMPGRNTLSTYGATHHGPCQNLRNEIAKLSEANRAYLKGPKYGTATADNERRLQRLLEIADELKRVTEVTAVETAACVKSDGAVAFLWRRDEN
jgi:hypothetical protein